MDKKNKTNICVNCKKEIKEEWAGDTFICREPTTVIDQVNHIYAHMRCFENYRKKKEPELIIKWNKDLKKRINYLLKHKNELEEKLADISEKTRSKINEKVRKNPWIKSSIPPVPDPKITVKTCFLCKVEYPIYDDETISIIEELLSEKIPASHSDFFRLCDKCRNDTWMPTNLFLYIFLPKLPPQYRDFAFWIRKLFKILHGNLTPPDIYEYVKQEYCSNQLKLS